MIGATGNAVDSSRLRGLINIMTQLKIGDNVKSNFEGVVVGFDRWDNHDLVKIELTPGDFIWARRDLISKKLNSIEEKLEEFLKSQEPLGEKFEKALPSDLTEYCRGDRV